jgi:hypothetical protein
MALPATRSVRMPHYFSVNISYLEQIRPTNFVCQISELFREDLSQRFAAFLARIGLPNNPEESSVAAQTA